MAKHLSTEPPVLDGKLRPLRSPRHRALVKGDVVLYRLSKSTVLPIRILDVATHDDGEVTFSGVNAQDSWDVFTKYGFEKDALLLRNW